MSTYRNSEGYHDPTPGAVFKRIEAEEQAERKDGAMYLVRDLSGTQLHIRAVSGDQAKRIFCRQFGVRPSDYWCGVRSLSARKLRPEEVMEYEASMPALRGTLTFIKGMMDICARAHEEKTSREAGRVETAV